MKMSGSCRIACTVPSAMACQYFNRLTTALLIGPDQEIGDIREWTRLGCVDCSIDLPSWHLISLSPLPNLDAGRLPHGQRGVRRIQVVLAHKDHGHVLYYGEVERLVEDALFDDPVTKETGRDPRQPIHLKGPRA